MENAKRPQILLVAVGVILSITFAYQLLIVNSEIDTASVGSIQKSAATEMATIESMSGGTIDEKYYQQMGKFLSGEAKVNNADLRLSVINSTVMSVVGLTISLAVTAYGYMLLRQKQ